MRPPDREACENVMLRIDQLKKLSVDQISGLPEERYEEVTLPSGDLLRLNTYKVNSEEDGMLLVVQGFFSTWKFPNYISTKGVGRMFAEGLVVRQGKISDAEESLLWEFL